MVVGVIVINDVLGVIIVGENLIGIYYKVKNDNVDGKGINIGVLGGILNDGRIEFIVKDVIVMLFDSLYFFKIVKNEYIGVIDL